MHVGKAGSEGSVSERWLRVCFAQRAAMVMCCRNALASGGEESVWTSVALKSQSQPLWTIVTTQGGVWLVLGGGWCGQNVG